MLIRSINFQKLMFLNHYDLINKFCFKNYYLIPKYNKISFTIFLKGFINFKFFKKYLSSFLLLYFFCYNFPTTKLKLFKFKNRKLRKHKVKLFLKYYITKKKIFLSTYNLFFIFNKYIRPFYFSIQNFIFSKFSGKLLFFNIKLIIFLPYSTFVDSIEQHSLFFLKKSKIFLTFTLQYFFTLLNYNFFNVAKLINKNFLKNFLLIWCLL